MTFTRKAVIGLFACLFIAGAVMASSTPAQAAGEVIKIGVVDIQRAMMKSKKGQAARSKIVGKIEQMQSELKRMDAELVRMQKELESQSSALSPDAKREKEKALARKARDFEDKYRDIQEQVQRDEYRTAQPIVNELLKIAQQIGKEGGYTLVIEGSKAGVIYAPEAVDITDEVIKRYDSGK